MTKITYITAVSYKLKRTVNGAFVNGDNVSVLVRDLVSEFALYHEVDAFDGDGHTAPWIEIKSEGPACDHLDIRKAHAEAVGLLTALLNVVGEVIEDVVG